MPRDPIPASTDWRGPDGPDGDAAVCSCQVMIEHTRKTQNAPAGGAKYTRYTVYLSIYKFKFSSY